MAGKAYFASIPLTSFLTNIPPLVSVKAGDQIQTVAKKLVTNNLYALPVFDDDHNCLGLIDLNDLLKALCDTIGVVTPENGREKFANAEGDGIKFNHLIASSVINLSGRNPYSPVSVDASLKEVVELLIAGTRRVPVLDKDGKLITIISPSTVVSFLSHHVTDEFLHESLSVLISTFPEKHVLVVERHTPVIIGLQTVNASNANSLAIMDGGRLISTFTLKDLKYLAEPRKFSKLYQEIGDYITEIRRSSPKSIFPAIHCYNTSTLESVLLRLTATKIHRMFVVTQDNQHPIGVISLRDVLETIYSKN